MSLPLRMASIVAVAVGSHAIVIAVRYISRWLIARFSDRSLAKIRTITSLLTSIIVFSLYFGAIGFVVNEFGLSLTGYFASASVIALAVGFGSQGVVQDVVMAMTIIVTDMLDIDDMVEISNQTGIVKNISMRFVTLENSLGATVLIPNRSIVNIVRYPRGYVRVHVDVTLPDNQDQASLIEKKVAAFVSSVVAQFAGVLRAPPEHMGRSATPSGKVYVRTKFRVWPNRTGPLETAFKQEFVSQLKIDVPDFADWMVSVNAEVDAT